MDSLSIFEDQNILFLKGCFISDVMSIEDQFDMRLIDTCTDVVTFCKIPDIFTCVEKWPRRTNLLCWFCSHSFDTTPVFVPEYINVVKKERRIGVRGNFCSWNCAAAYIDATFDRDRWEKHNLLISLYEIMEGKSVTTIIPSAPRTSLKCYGGAMEKHEYVKKIKFLNIDYESTIANNSLEFSHPHDA